MKLSEILSEVTKDHWTDNVAAKLARFITGDKDTPMTPSERAAARKEKEKERKDGARQLTKKVGS
jgi:hypothetical protein